jgi:hypothetical protein
VPPAVTLLIYISCGILWRIFCQTEIFPGFSLYIININNAVRISEAAMGGAGDILLTKKNKTKIVRTYGRTRIYMNLTPNGSKKGRTRRQRIALKRRIRRDKKRRIRREG